MDAEAWLAAFADDAVSHDPVGTLPLVGHAALRQAMQRLCDAVEQIGRYEDAIFVVGNSAATFEGIDVVTVKRSGEDRDGNDVLGPAGDASRTGRSGPVWEIEMVFS